jgi:glycosyltransferase involved in cell wall biosynthesis
VYNEAESIPQLVASVRSALQTSPPWELILVNDGSTDDTVRVASEAVASDDHVRLVCLARNYGQTQAMQAGFDHALGDVIVTMDGDLQNDPVDIPRLVATLDEGYDLVAGYRLRRQDALLTRKVPSWVANRLIAWITGVHIRDNGCSLKAYRRSLLRQLRLYSDMHRFLPALAAATAAARIVEVPVRHHARRFGMSKYGLSRTAKILADLLTIKMISSFRERPLRLFSSGAVWSAAASLVVLIIWARSITVYRVQPEGAYVLPAIVLLFLALAVYLLMLGLIAEVALHSARREEQDALNQSLRGSP